MPKRLVRRKRDPSCKGSSDSLERLRENNPRRLPMPVPFAEGLKAVLQERKAVGKSRRLRLDQALRLALEEVLGDGATTAAEQVNAVSYREGVLSLSVSGPALAREIGIVYKRALLEAMRRLLGEATTVTDLRVRASRSGRSRRDGR